jgi:hypothetical protein
MLRELLLQHGTCSADISHNFQTSFYMSSTDQKLCVLLYLTLIDTVTTYSMSQLHGIANQNQAAIGSVEMNPILYAQVQSDYATQASTVPIIDKKEEWDE